MLTYNDFELSDIFSESVVASTIGGSNEKEENRLYFINRGILII